MASVRAVNPDLLRIHAEDAGFVATQRDMALEAPNYRLIDIYDLEQRLHGHFDALVLAGDAGCETARILAEKGDGESAGVLLHVGLCCRRKDRVDAAVALAHGAEDPSRFRDQLGLAAAWCPAETLSGVMSNWITSREPLLRWMALDVCGRHRVNPRHHLDAALDDLDAAVRDRAIRLAGELGRVDCLDRIRAHSGCEADIAAVLLGDKGRARQLAEAENCRSDARTARRVAELFPIPLPEAEAQDAIRSLLASSLTRRWGIVALGALGSARTLPWLAEVMSEPLHARVTVSALEQITGVYVAHHGLELAEFPEAPENPVVDGDPTESLIEANTPWPNPDKVAAWLDKNAARFPLGERLLLGLAAWTFKGPPEPWVRFQARYRAIALTQALNKPAAPCPNWRSPVEFRGRTFTRAW